MICVVGAGSVGCYVGGRLAAAGADVVLVGRRSIVDEVARSGLRLTDYRGGDVRVADPRVTTDLSAASSADLVLVAVKSGDTAAAAAELAAQVGPEALVVSLQNGLHNAEALGGVLGAARCVAGMVPFNVVRRGEGAFHQASEGEIHLASDARLTPYARVFTDSGLGLVMREDMPSVLWAKLLLNLNNAVNALSGLPLATELRQREYRLCLASAQTEALSVIRAAGASAARLTPLPATVLPYVLRLPDAVFARVASRMVQIDPLARSSMSDDLDRGRPTEIDWINGEVVREAARVGLTAPVNERLVSLVRDAERGGRRNWSGAALRAVLAEDRRRT